MTSSVCLQAQVSKDKAPFKILALGDSYTIGEGVAENDRFPNQLGELLMLKGYKMESVEIIAKTGWRTDQLMSAIDQLKPARNYDLVTLLIGVNNQYQGKLRDDYPHEFKELVDVAISLAGGHANRVLVLSIPDYSYTPFGQKKERPAKISNEINFYNRNNKIISKQYGVLYVNITRLSRAGLKDPSLLAPDGLHPSGKLYGMWVHEIINALGI